MAFQDIALQANCLARWGIGKRDMPYGPGSGLAAPLFPGPGPGPGPEPLRSAPGSPGLIHLHSTKGPSLTDLNQLE